MTREEFLAALRDLRRAPGKSGTQAPHKPLMLLIALAEVESRGGRNNAFRYAELRERFDRLWPRFGWQTRSGATKAAYPFWYLANEPVWELRGPEGRLDIAGTKTPSEARLAELVTQAQFPMAAWRVVADARARREAIDLLCATYFLDSQQDDLRDALGLTWESGRPAVGAVGESRATGRDAAAQAAFRQEVMLAYEHRCAVCDFGPRTDRSPAAVQAAHVWPARWDGPYTLDNGMALCHLHHWAWDSGTIGLADDYTILVSGRVADGEPLQVFVRAFAGRPLRAPLPTRPRPALEHVARHRDSVFLGEAI